MQTESTYESILDVAEALIQKRGFNAFSYRDVARSLGIQTSSVHYHFRTKAELARSIVSRYRSFFDTVLADLAKEVKCPVARLARYADLYITTFQNEGRLCLCLSLASDFDTLEENVQNEVRGFWGDQESWLADLLADYVAEGGTHRSTDPVSVSKAILGALQGAMISARVYSSAEPLVGAKQWILSTLK